MPTSSALTPETTPCYFLGPSDPIGSFKATCSDALASPSNPPSTDGDSENEPAASASPGLQSGPATNDAGAGPGWCWVEMCTNALMAMGAVEVIAWA